MNNYKDIKTATDTRLFLRNFVYDETISIFEDALKEIFELRDFDYSYNAESKIVEFVLDEYADYSTCIKAAYCRYISRIGDFISHVYADADIYLCIQHIMNGTYPNMNYLYNFTIYDYGNKNYKIQINL